MTLHRTPPDRPSAAWISSYAAGLLKTTPSLRPLDAVRLAMDACDDRARPPAEMPAQRTPRQPS